MSILTKALISKPKKLKDGWEHKNGFYVSIDAKSAFAIIDNARNKRQYSTSKRPNHYKQLSSEKLRALAESRLYEIESSSNNYIEYICAVGGLFVLIYLTDLLMQIWNYPSQSSVRLFLMLTLLFGFLIFLYFKKEKIVSYLVEDFLDIENALRLLEDSECQYHR
jgi:hypothetical protein